MLKRLDKIRFRGPRSRDELLDLAESPPASDNEGGDDLPIKPRPLPREMDDQLRDPVSDVWWYERERERERALLSAYTEISFSSMASPSKIHNETYNTGLVTRKKQHTLWTIDTDLAAEQTGA